MTTLMSTSPPLFGSTASTMLLASTALSPRHECALGFIWVIKLAACMPNEDSQNPRTVFKRCKIGYAFHGRFQQCLRKKYKGNWKKERERYNPTKSTTTEKSTYSDEGSLDVDQGDSYGSGPSSGSLLGYGDNLGATTAES